MPRKKTNEEFVKELEKVNPNIELLEEYKYALEPILCRCKKDGYVWKSRPADLLKGKGCPKCAGNIKKTHDEFVEEMKYLQLNGIPYVFVKNIKGVTTYKYTKSKRLFEVLSKFYSDK